MSDLISRQAAINALQEKVFHNLSDEFYGTMQVLNELPSAQPEVLAHGEGELSAQQEPRWTPCSERLPKVTIGLDSEVNTYLVTVDDGAIYTDIDIIRTSGFTKYGSNVTAWMPLPEPMRQED